MDECCRTGFLDEGTTTGTVAPLGGCSTYWAKPEAPTDKAVVLCTDIFGYELPNIRLMADMLCRETGFLIVVPDVFDGDAMPVTLLDVMDEKPTSVLGTVGKGARLFGTIAFGFLPWMFRHGDGPLVPK